MTNTGYFDATDIVFARFDEQHFIYWMHYADTQRPPLPYGHVEIVDTILSLYMHGTPCALLPDNAPQDTLRGPDGLSPRMRDQLFRCFTPYIETSHERGMLDDYGRIIQ